VEHPSIERAIVVGIKHARLVETVGAFLQRTPGAHRPSDDEIRRWTSQTLGRHKCPQHIFWLGEDGMTGNIPLTGSGKIQKFALRDIGEQYLANKAADYARPRL
jgi:acyl-CoA synthetase (AMP-forming)/AMP-acid ligase II